MAGVYPLLPDETCWFLAADFDEESWAADALAVLETCQAKGVPAALERSRSGNGGHVWIFFSEPVSARTARQLGAAMLTETMERRPEIGFASYDRFFPSQDTMPVGGFGNLIALPLQRRARELGNSVFIDQDLRLYDDQWAFLAARPRLSAKAVAEEAVELIRGAHGLIEARKASPCHYLRGPWCHRICEALCLSDLLQFLTASRSLVRMELPTSGLGFSHGRTCHSQTSLFGQRLPSRCVRDRLISCFTRPEAWRTAAVASPRRRPHPP